MNNQNNQRKKSHNYYEYYTNNKANINLRKELKKLISEYNKITDKNLFIYYGMPIPVPNADVSMCRNDYETIYHMLRNDEHKSIDVLIATPGGHGDAAKEIGNFLQKKYETINMVIAGEAKSAGTILAMCGDTINMTETGCLGPIDAQIPNFKGSYYSAYDYVKWVEDKKQEVNERILAKKEPFLSPVDQIIIAQINHGELEKAKNALEFGKEIVIEWLWRRKFKHWIETETNKTRVTEDLRKKRAKEIAEILSNHEKWRDHGRSIKAHELSDKLKIDILKDGDDVTELIYKIHTVCQIMSMFDMTFKIIGNQDVLLLSGAGFTLPTPQLNQKELNNINNIKQVLNENGYVPLTFTCQACGTVNNIVLSNVKKEDIMEKIGTKYGKIIDLSEKIIQCIGCNKDINITNICEELKK